MSSFRVKNKDGTWDKVPVLGSYQAVLAANEAATNAQNAAKEAEKIATDLGLVDEAVQTAVASATTASNKADIATAKADVATAKASEASASAATATQKADAASTSATNAAQSYANADAVATQLTEYLATKETLTAPAVDKTLLIEGAAADAKAVGKLKSEIATIKYPINVYFAGVIKDGYVLNDDNTESADIQYFISDYFYVDAGETYTLKAYAGKFGASLVKAQHFYDANKEHLRTVGTYNASDQTVTVVAPVNAVYMRVTVKYSDENNYMVLVGDKYSDKYIKHNIVLLKDNVIIENIEKENVSFMHSSDFENVYNPNDSEIINGSIILANGNTEENANFNISGYIPCFDGDTFTFPVYTRYFGVGSNATYVAGLNENKEFVMGILGTLTNSVLTFTIPANYQIRYFRVNVLRFDTNSDDIQTPYHTNSNFMVIKGTSLPAKEYISYNPKIYLDSDIYSNNSNVSNPLFQKSIVFLGDSICEGDEKSGWAGRIGRNNNMFWHNQGIGGSTISTVLAGKAICTRTIIMDSPDYIIFEGGTNDADRIGSIIEGEIPSLFGSYIDNYYGIDDEEAYYGFNIDTFCGAFEYLCKRLTTKYAGKKIGYIVPPKMSRTNNYLPSGNNRRAYFEYAINICKKWGIPYLNLWDGCYLNPMNSTHYVQDNEDSFYLDGQHLRKNGYDYISPMIESWIKTL